MAEIIVMPKLGFNMSEGKLVVWYKKEGEAIRKGEPFFSIETDKTAIDVEATLDGVVRKLFIAENEKSPVTLPIAIIGGAEENIEAALSEAAGQLGGEASPAQTAPPAPAAKSEIAPPQTARPAANRDFDIVVIGGGPGGYVAAIKGAQIGKRVAVAEKEHFGGVCLNRGCIPTKTLLRSVEALREARACAEFGVTGVDASKAALDMKKVQTRKQGIIAQLVGGVEALLAGNGVTKLTGEARIKDANTVTVAGRDYTTENIIIATGSEVKQLPVETEGRPVILTSDEILNLETLPKDIVIVGGGVIGIEFAYFLANAGVKVTVVEFLDHILPMVDEEISDRVVKRFTEAGVTIHTGAKVTKITQEAVFFEEAGAVRSVKTRAVLMAVGRIPCFGGLDPEKLGVKTERGAIVTDENLRTSVPNIYAVGDVNGRVMLAHTASAEGVAAVRHIAGESVKMRYDRIPSAVYIRPEIACVGLTERQAEEKYGSVKIGRFPLAANGKAKVAGEDDGLVKIILEPEYGEIVGAHIHAIHATDMIAEIVVAMAAEATGEEVADAIHPHPTVSESIAEAIHAAFGRAIHF